MLRIRGPINYPKAAPKPARDNTPTRGPTLSAASIQIEDAIISGMSTAELGAKFAVTNRAIQARKRRLRNKGYEV